MIYIKWHLSSHCQLYYYSLIKLSFIKRKVSVKYFISKHTYWNIFYLFRAWW